MCDFASDRNTWTFSLFALAVAMFATPLIVSAYQDKPPPGNTGGFGESSCHQCHFDHPLNDQEGSLNIHGLPEFYEPNSQYLIRITLKRPALKRGGFQLATRFTGGAQAGRQAGSLQPFDDRVAVMTSDDGAIQYAHHSEVASQPSSRDEISWALLWIAPEFSGAPVAFHVAANACNDDDSSFGDFIYLKEVVSQVAIAGIMHNFRYEEPQALR